MVKSEKTMLISEFARETGLSVDTVRFYVRRGLIAPAIGRMGGSNPYQMFSEKDADVARVIRLAQSLGFSLKEIAALNDEYVAGKMTPDRSREIMQGQLVRLEEKAEQLAGMIAYVHAKIAWLDGGSRGPEPMLGAVACARAMPSSAKTRKEVTSPKRARTLRRAS